MSKSIDPNDLQYDPLNANQGTDRGLELLRESMTQCGVGRSIVVDKNGFVIAGNKTLKIARERGVPIKVVDATGHELVVVQRTDLDLIERPEARQLAYYDNRVSEVGLSWDGEQVKRDMLAGIDLSTSFFPEELDRVIPPDPVHEEEPVADAFEGAETAVEAAVAEEPVEEAPALDVPVDEDAPLVPKPVHPTVVLTFDNIVQQVRWASFMRALKDRYPQVETPSARLSVYLTEIGIDA